MSTPVPPLVPTSAMPLATDSDAAFDAKAFPALASLNPFGVSLEAIGAATVANANAALAAALGGDLPAITGQALKLLRVNAGETAAEFVDPATVVLAEAPELSQVQVENPASTVFGQVSGERLSQAAEAKIVDRFNLTGTAPTYACRAWVNFNGTGTVAIRASGNVSSITDNGSGDYTVNFTTAMEDVNYSFTGSAGSVDGLNIMCVPTSFLAGSIRFLATTGGNTKTDKTHICISIFR